MRKHLLRITLFYFLFELLREVAGNISLWVRGQPIFPWIHSKQGAFLNVGGFFIFLLYPLAAYIIFERGFRKSKRQTLLYWIVSVGIIISIRYSIEELLYPWQFDFRNYWAGTPLLYYYIDNIYYAFLYSAFGIVYFFVQNEYQHQLKQTQLMLENKQTELSFLRSQVNPHFLFNSLNNIYSLVYHQSDQSLTAIARLSDLLRYMLYDTNEKVPLQKELEYIEKYMELQQMRFESALPANMEITGNPGKAHIPPLLLIPFVENAFKHGDTSNGNQIHIKLQANEALIRFYISNAVSQRQKDTGGGIGLENVQRRLELLYPGRYTLQVQETSELFEVELEIRNDNK
ncbi:histidine kinase [Pseudoflavitalea sp. X16]|uniref:sensor histidine kinase n=1 Tax=Paraflavitalea devenefica TaxID=2716334 RepID=UPI001423F7F7|nr:histidine kinase [Paraflavitalea devenefica]NII24830.1 histidine kinase [Paraflavitalea devenefica]